MASASASRASRRRRRVTRILATASLLLGLGSCTSVIGLDGYASVAEEMCSLLDRCYETSDKTTCQGKLEAALSVSDRNARTLLLTFITDSHCLDSCRDSRVCVDVEPLCAPAGSCEQAQECCGSLEGHADCVDNTCCATRGSKCTEDKDCCASAGDCVDGICGRVRCIEKGQRCNHDVECCTGACNDHLCAKTTCNPNKFECIVDADCCSDFCAPGLNLCATRPTCAEAGTACVVETDCCAGTHCRHQPGSLEGQCAAPDCVADSLDCATDDQCCSGHCDRTLFFCAAACAAEDHACAADADCCTGKCEGKLCKGACSTTYCAADDDCCSGACVAGACRAECGSPTEHSPCTAGGPLSGDKDTTNKLCVDAVCAEDPYCCCGAWDDICIARVTGLAEPCANACH